MKMLYFDMFLYIYLFLSSKIIYKYVSKISRKITKLELGFKCQGIFWCKNVLGQTGLLVNKIRGKPK